MEPRTSVRGAPLKNLNTFLEELSKLDGFSGSVLLAEKGEAIFSYTAGFANRRKKTKNQLETIFNIGSLDKMFTGVAIAQLAERNKLNFKDKIGKYLSYYPKDIAKRMTIHHLLTHTDGLPSYLNDKYIERRLKLNTTKDYLDLFKDEALLFEPGERYQYSNSGYVVLGAIIEAITGLSYEDYVSENIFKVADMPDSGLLTPDRSNEKMAIGYTQYFPFSHRVAGKSRRENFSELPTKGSPAGGGYSTCLDLVNFSQALFQDKLLTSQMRKFVLAPKITIEKKHGQTLQQGYGFQILKLSSGSVRYGHAGAFAGVSARIDIYPWKGLTLVVLANYDKPAAFRVANRVTELIGA